MSLPDHVDVAGWNRRQLPPEGVECVTVEASRARLGGVSDRPGAARRSPRRAPADRVELDQRAGRPGVIEVDVGEEEVPDLGEREAAPIEGREPRRHGRRRAAVEERRPVARLDQVAADRPVDAGVEEIDRCERHPRTYRMPGGRQRSKDAREVARSRHGTVTHSCCCQIRIDLVGRRPVAQILAGADMSWRDPSGEGDHDAQAVADAEPEPVATLSSACSRSAIRSRADSRTDSRTRFLGLANGASAVDECVIRAGCSIRLSTPPSDLRASTLASARRARRRSPRCR